MLESFPHAVAVVVVAVPRRKCGAFVTLSSFPEHITSCRLPAANTTPRLAREVLGITNVKWIDAAGVDRPVSISIGSNGRIWPKVDLKQREKPTLDCAHKALAWAFHRFPMLHQLFAVSARTDSLQCNGMAEAENHARHVFGCM